MPSAASGNWLLFSNFGFLPNDPRPPNGTDSEAPTARSPNFVEAPSIGPPNTLVREAVPVFAPSAPGGSGASDGAREWCQLKLRIARLPSRNSEVPVLN